MTFNYSAANWRQFQEGAITIDGVPLLFDNITWEDYPGGGHPGWQRGYKRLTPLPIWLQLWRLGDEVLHFELLSEEYQLDPNADPDYLGTYTTGQGIHTVVVDCKPYMLWAQGGIAWSNEDRLVALFSDGAANTQYDGFYISQFSQGPDGVDEPKTSITGSPRMAFNWSPYLWSSSIAGVAGGKTPRAVAFMDEWLRLQVQRPYQWPSQNIRGLSGGYDLFTAAPDGAPPPNTSTTVGWPGVGTNSIGGLTRNWFGQNGFNHSHLAFSQLVGIYLRYRWPRALDQAIRLYFAAYYDLGGHYWRMSPTQAYGETARFVGWMLNATGLLIRVLTVANAGSGAFDATIAKLLLFLDWHVTHIYGSGPPFGHGIAGSGTYPITTASQSGGHHYTPNGFRIGFMEGILLHGMMVAWYELYSLGLAGNSTATKLLAMIGDASPGSSGGLVTWCETSGWTRKSYVGRSLNPNITGGHIAGVFSTAFARADFATGTGQSFYARFLPGTIKVTAVVDGGVGTVVFQDLAKDGVLTQTSGTTVTASVRSVIYENGTINLTITGRSITSATLDLDLFAHRYDTPVDPNGTVDGYPTTVFVPSSLVKITAGNVVDITSITGSALVGVKAPSIKPGTLVITASISGVNGPCVFNDDGLGGFVQVSGPAQTINAPSSVVYGSLAVPTPKITLDLANTILSATISYQWRDHCIVGSTGVFGPRTQSGELHALVFGLVNPGSLFVTVTVGGQVCVFHDDSLGSLTQVSGPAQTIVTGTIDYSASTLVLDLGAANTAVSSAYAEYGCAPGYADPMGTGGKWQFEGLARVASVFAVPYGAGARSYRDWWFNLGSPEATMFDDDFNPFMASEFPAFLPQIWMHD